MNREADFGGYGKCEMCVLLKKDAGVCIQGRLWFNGVVSGRVEGEACSVLGRTGKF